MADFQTGSTLATPQPATVSPDDTIGAYINSAPITVTEKMPSPVKYGTDLDSYVNSPPDPAFTPKPSKTGLTAEPAPGWQAGMKALNDRLAIGGASMHKSVAGFEMLTGGVSFKQAQEQVMTQDFQRAQSDTEDYNNTHGYWSLTKMQYMPPSEDQGVNQEASNDDDVKVSLADIPGWLVEQVPQLAQVGVGAGYGALAGSVFGPAGVATGALIGSAVATGAVIMGSHFYDQTERGVDRQTALIGAVISGAIGGAATTFGLSALGEALPSAARVAFESQGFRQIVTGVTGSLLKHVGINVVANDVQSLTDSTCKYFETRVSKVDKPFTLQEGLRDLLASTAQGTVVGTAFGGFTTVTGLHAGLRAKAIHAAIERRTMEISQEHETAQTSNALQVAAKEKENQETLAVRTTEQKAKAHKQLKGFVEVSQTLDVQTAQHNLEQAKASLQATPEDGKAVASLAVNQAAAELKHAQHEAQIKAIEDTLTTPDLAESVAHRKTVLEGKIQTVKELLEETDTDTEKKALGAKLGKLKGALRTVRDLEALGSDANIRAEITQQKERIEKHATDTRLQVAESALKRRMAEREHQIDKLRGEIREDKRQARTGDQEPSELENTVADAQAHLDWAEQPEDEKAQSARIVKTNEYKSIHGGLAAEHPDWGMVKLQSATMKEVQRLHADLWSSEGRSNGTAKQITEARAEVRAAQLREGGGADTANSRERLEQLRQQQELDELLMQLISEKLVTADDIADLTPKVPTKRLLGLLEIAKRQVDKAAQSGARGQKRMMEAAKRLLDSVIDLSRLPKQDKLALKAKYSAVDLQKLAEALPQVEAKIKGLFEKRRVEAARADLKRQLETIKYEPKAVSKTPGKEELLSAIKAFAADHSAIERLEQSLETKDVLSEVDEAQLEIAQLFPVPVDEMTAPQIERVIDNIVELRETGKAEAARRFQEKQTRQQEKAAILKQRMAPTERGKARQKESLLHTMRNMFDDSINAEITTFRGLMTILSQFGEISDMSDILDLKSALSEAHKQRIHWETRWKDMVAEAGLNAKEWHRFNIKANKRGQKLQYLKEISDGQAVTYTPMDLEHSNGKPLSLWEMIQARNYLLDTDPDAVSRFSKGNKFSYPGEVPHGESTLETIESYLNDTLPNWRKVADAMRKFYGEFSDVVDEASFRRFGRHIQKNETYGGELFSSTEPGSRFRESSRRFTARPGSLLERQGGSQRVKIRNAMDNLKNHIAGYARENALMEFEQDAQALFMRDQSMRDYIEKHIGENTLKVIDKYIEDVVLGYNRSYSTVDKVAAWLRESLYSRFLGARPEQFAKQVTGFIHALQFVGPDAMIDGYSYMIANPKKAAELMHESGLLQARKAVRDPDFRPEATSQLRRFNNLLMKSVEVGDHYSIYGAAFPVLLDTLRKTGDETKARKAFETAFDTTQSSGSVDELPNLFRGNAILRLFTVMAQEPTRQIEAINTAWRKFRNKPSADGFAHYTKIVGITYAGAFLYNLVGWIVLYPFMSSDQAEKKLTYIMDLAPLGPFSGTAILGNLLSAMTVSSFKLVFNQNTKAYEPSLLATDVTGDVFKLWQKLQKLDADGGGEAADYWAALMMAGNAIGDVTGLPVTNILSKVEPFIGVKE